MAFWIDASAELAHEAAPLPASRPSSSHSAPHSAKYSVSPKRGPPPSPFAKGLSGYSPPMSPYRKPRSPFLAIKSPSLRRQSGTQTRVQVLKDAEGRNSMSKPTPVRNRSVHGAHTNHIKRPLSATTPMSPKHPPPAHLRRPSLNPRPSVDDTSLKSAQLKSAAHRGVDAKVADNLNRDAEGIVTKMSKRQSSDTAEKSRKPRTCREGTGRENGKSVARLPRTQLSASPKLQNTPVPTQAAVPSPLPESKGLARARTTPREGSPSCKGTASPRRSRSRR